MSLLKNKKKQEEPEFLRSALNTSVKNYNVYKMPQKMKIIYFILAFVVGAFVGYVFYGGIGADEYGPTLTTHICNAIVMSIAGFVLGIIYIPIRTEQIRKNRTQQIRMQFISLLDSLSTSIASGKNVSKAFEAARDDLVVQFSEESIIVEEIDIVLSGLHNNIAIEDMLADFGKRSGIKDIENFGSVFEISYKRGANLKDVIRNTHDILCKKILIEAEIETKITSGKNELNVMLVMPVILIAMMKFTGGDFASKFVTPTGLISTTFAIFIFVMAFFIGRYVMKIEV